jgi:hypothetical protein
LKILKKSSQVNLSPSFIIMQLLHASPIAGPEFISLSILLKPKSAEQITFCMGEPMMLVSPATTVSSSESIEALKELHSHLTVVLKASSEKPGKQDRLTHEFFKEDEKQLDEMQIFRPSSAHGVGLHYRLIRGDDSLIAKLSAHILGSNKSSTASTGIATPADVSGVVLCVGMSGLPFAHSSSPLHYSLAQRMNYCTSLLQKAVAKDIAGVKVLMSTFLLADDDSRVTNEMAEAANLFYMSVPEEGGSKGVMSPIGIKKSKPKTIKGEEMGVSLALAEGSAEASRAMTQRMTVMSVVETDAFLRRYAASGQERKANLDLTGGKKSKFRRRKTDARDADFDNFEYKGPVKTAVVAQAAQAMPALAKSGQKLQLRQPKKDSRAKTPGVAPPAPSVAPPTPLMAPRQDGGPSRRASAHAGSRPGLGESSERLSSRNLMSDDPGSRGQKLSTAFAQKGPSKRGSSRTSEDDDSGSLTHTFVGDTSTVASQTRVQVNIALNEDLACSYKQSVLSTCSVEGVVQVRLLAMI